MKGQEVIKNIGVILYFWDCKHSQLCLQKSYLDFVMWVKGTASPDNNAGGKLDDISTHKIGAWFICCLGALDVQTD